MEKPAMEISRLSVRGQFILPKRIRDYLGVGPGDRVALVPLDEGVLVKKAPEESLRDLVLAIGRDAQAQRLSEKDVEEDIDHHVKQWKRRRK
jgi:AbrB family looped-hinge helix DNA binding protein